MTPSTRPVPFEHPALQGPPGQGFERLCEDSSRLVVLLEACALVALLGKVGFEVDEASWIGNGLDEKGHLGGVVVRERGDDRLWRQQVDALARRLFRWPESPTGGPCEGRGAVRRAVRRWLRCSRAVGGPSTPAQLVSSLFEFYPGLWKPRFAEARSRLVAVGADGLLVAAPATIARDIERSGLTFTEVRDRLASGRAEEFWFGEAGLDPEQKVSLHERAWRLRTAVRRIGDADPSSVGRSPAGQLISLGELRLASGQLGRETRLETPACSALRLRADRLRARERSWKRRLESIRRGLDESNPQRRAAALAVCQWAQRLRMDPCWGEIVPGSSSMDDGRRVDLGRHAALALIRAREELNRSCAAGAEERSVRACRLLAAGGDSVALWSARTLAVAARWARGVHDARDAQTLKDAWEYFERRGVLVGCVDVLEVECDVAEFRRDWAAQLHVLERLRRRLERESLEARRLDLCAARLRVVAGVAAEVDADHLRLPSLLARDQRIEIAAVAAPGEIEELLEDDPVSDLWRSLMAGETPPAEAWLDLEALGDFRAARCVVSMVRTAPDLVPPGVASWASARLLELGWTTFSGLLNGGRGIDCAALRAFLSSSDPENAAPRLLEECGYREVALEWQIGDEIRCLASGGRGSQRWTTNARAGRIVVRSEVIDEPLKVLVGLVGQRLRRPPLRTLDGSQGRILGRSAALRAALARLDELAKAEISVLLQGESGTGKELAARRLHRKSPRAGRPFLAYNCAAVDDSLLLGDLFGHVRGAFTGADRERRGVLESAEGGTVLLDEVADLSPAAQGALLRFLQEGEVRRLGESRARRVDVRVVAATHREIPRLVRERRFRHDLYFRLAAATVVLPPLRERGEDIVRLSEHILAEVGPEVELTDEARSRLREYSWPGNVRELKNRLQVASSLCEGGLVRARDLELPQSTAGGPSYHRRLDDFRREILSRALSEAGGVVAEAARGLGITRQALAYLIKRLELEDGQWTRDAGAIDDDCHPSALQSG